MQCTQLMSKLLLGKKREPRKYNMVDSELADQKLPKELRLWTDADYQKRQSPHPSRLKTESDGFMGKSIPQKKMMSKRTLSDTK